MRHSKKSRLFKMIIDRHQGLIVFGMKQFFNTPLRNHEWISREDFTQELYRLLWSALDKIKPYNKNDYYQVSLYFQNNKLDKSKEKLIKMYNIPVKNIDEIIKNVKQGSSVYDELAIVEVMKMFKVMMYRYISVEKKKNFQKKNKANAIYNIDTIEHNTEDKVAGYAMDSMTKHCIKACEFVLDDKNLEIIVDEDYQKYYNHEFIMYILHKKASYNHISIFLLIINHLPNFIKTCKDHDRNKNKHLGFINRTHLSKFTGLSNGEVGIILKDLKRWADIWKKKKNLELV